MKSTDFTRRRNSSPRGVLDEAQPEPNRIRISVHKRGENVAMEIVIQPEVLASVGDLNPYQSLASCGF
jgi:hypothetical protein